MAGASENTEFNSSISPDTADIVVEGIAGGTPLRQLARMHGFSKSAWYRLVESDEELSGRVAHARVRGFEELAEETLEIADDGTNDWIKRENGDPGVNGEHVSRSKLRIETRLKLLACWDPKRYGPKPAGDADNPIHVVNTIRREVVDPNAG